LFLSAVSILVASILGFADSNSSLAILNIVSRLALSIGFGCASLLVLLLLMINCSLNALSLLFGWFGFWLCFLGSRVFFSSIK
jgi:hypothetical protein